MARTLPRLIMCSNLACAETGSSGLPANLEQNLLCLVKAHDTTGTARGWMELYLSILKGLVSSTDTEPAAGRYTIVVDKPLRIHLTKQDAGRSVDEFLCFRDTDPQFRAGEFHEIASRLVVTLSNPSWRLALDPRSDWGVSLARGGGECRLSMWLENPASLRRFTLAEANYEILKVRGAGLLAWPGEVMKTLGFGS